MNVVIFNWMIESVNTLMIFLKAESQDEVCHLLTSHEQFWRIICGIQSKLLIPKSFRNHLLFTMFTNSLIVYGVLSADSNPILVHLIWKVLINRWLWEGVDIIVSTTRYTWPHLTSFCWQWLALFISDTHASRLSPVLGAQNESFHVDLRRSPSAVSISSYKGVT